MDTTDFFLVSAHELRTSLSAMKWLFKMLHDGDYGPLNDEQKTVIEQATRANESMITLLNDTITAIKNEDMLTYAHTPVHLPLLIAEIIKEFTNEATAKRIALTYHQSPVPITIVGDEGKFRIALHNIIENAIKYSNSNTEIVVTLATKEDTAVVTVSDHGIGISNDHRAHLFEKFFRAGNSTESGTGLGLYSTKQIIERMSGTISIESQEHVGTTVTISLPLVR